jgi:hypothetical protein
VIAATLEQIVPLRHRLTCSGSSNITAATAAAAAVVQYHSSSTGTQYEAIAIVVYSIHTAVERRHALF